MNLNRKDKAPAVPANITRCCNAAISTALLLLFLGCASSPEIRTIKHMNTLPMDKAVSAQPEQAMLKGSVAQGADAPADQLKNTKVEAGAQTTPATAQPAPQPAHQEPLAQNTAAPADQVKNASAPSEAPIVPQTAQPAPQTPTEKSVAGVVPAPDTKGQTEKSEPDSPEELRKNIEDQLRSELTASFRAELKTLEEQVSSKARTDTLQEIEKLKQEIMDLEEQQKRDQDEKNAAYNDMLRDSWTLKQAAASAEWTRRVRISGDFRLRYESDRFDTNNGPYPDYSKTLQPNTTGGVPYLNTTADQDLYKYRVRLGLDTKVNEHVDAVFRLSTGNTSNPVSTNSTMNDYMNKDSVVFDLAYIKWRPGKAFTLFGGRMPNPWFSTDLVWSPNLNFEGLALQVTQPVSETITPFLTIGAFPLQQIDQASQSGFSQHSKWLYAGQVGVERKEPKAISTKFGAAYYDFYNIKGVPNDLGDNNNDWTAPLFVQKGNTMFDINAANTNGYWLSGLASEFKELNVTGTIDIGFWDPFHIIFLGDYVKNLGYDKAAVDQVAPDQPVGIEGYQFGLSLGHPVVQDAGQWKAYWYYKRLGANAVVDAFTDSDFHLGGTNAKGWIMGSDIGLGKNFWLGLKWMTANEVSGPPLAIDVLQIDLNAKF